MRAGLGSRTAKAVPPKPGFFRAPFFLFVQSEVAPPCAPLSTRVRKCLSKIGCVRRRKKNAKPLDTISSPDLNFPKALKICSSETDVMMRFNQLIVAGLVVAVCGFCAFGCGKKAPAPAKLDPHSPEAVNEEIQLQQPLLTAAFNKDDLIYVHRKMFYMESLADALSLKLAGQEKKPRVDAIIVELKEWTEKIDNSGGRKQKEATGENLQNLYLVLKKLNAEFVTPTSKK